MQDRLDLDVASEVEPSAGVPRRPHVRQERIFRQPSSEPLLATDLSSLIPEGDACLWIREGLSRIDLSCVRELYDDCGGVAYDPRAMLGILLYAYFEGETGSRTIEKRCRRDVAYMHAGYGQKPDDRTIRRFRRRVGPALEEVFRLVVQECRNEGLLPFRRVAVDDTKIASAASQLKRWLTLGEKDDVSEMGLEPEDCPDPDARKVGASGKFCLGYNCQAAVDCDSGVVVAVQVGNVNSDGHLLAPMLEETVRNAGEVPGEVVADAGYDTNEGVSVCAELGIVAFVAPQYPAASFWSVDEDDEIFCPMGNPVRSVGISFTHGKPRQTLKVVGCSACPFFHECCGSSGTRGLSFPVGSDPVQRLNATYRARSPEGKAAMKERLATIETVFADIKWNKGFRRFTLKGLEGATVEWTLEHLARNLAKLGKALRALLLTLFFPLYNAKLRRQDPTSRLRTSQTALTLRRRQFRQLKLATH